MVKRKQPKLYGKHFYYTRQRSCTRVIVDTTFLIISIPHSTQSREIPLNKGVSRSVIDFFSSTSLTLFLKRIFRVEKRTSPYQKACIPESESIAFGAVKHCFVSGKALTLDAQSIDFRHSEHCSRGYGALLQRLQSTAPEVTEHCSIQVQSTAP